MTWQLLAIKLTTTPALIAAATLIGRRWGTSLSGWIAGVPLTTGPLALYFALEQGVPFASRAALGILTGVISLTAFCAVYARLASLGSWLPATIAALVAFSIVTAVSRIVAPGLPVAAGVATIAILLTLVSLPAAARSSLPDRFYRWDIPARMAIATVTVVVLSAAGPALGPQLAGLVAPVPVFVGLMTVFAHRIEGASAAIEVLRGAVLGTFGFGAFFACLALILPDAGVGAAFLAALAANVVTQAASFWLLRLITSGGCRGCI